MLPVILWIVMHQCLYSDPSSDEDDSEKSSAEDMLMLPSEPT